MPISNDGIIGSEAAGRAHICERLFGLWQILREETKRTVDCVHLILKLSKGFSYRKLEN